jgi:hypothetical protein
MPTYEYRTEVLTHGFLGRKDEEFDRKEFEERLNQVGAEGWEFDKLIPDMALHGEKDGHLLVFKRERYRSRVRRPRRSGGVRARGTGSPRA